MSIKPQMDALGATALTTFALLLAFNQVLIKWVNTGLQPVFAAGLRSAIALGVLLLFFAVQRRYAFGWRHWRAGILVGMAFSMEFVCLFLALDYTTVSRASIIFYSMPVWLAVASHFLLPGDKMHARKLGGLLLAFSGVVLALGIRDDSAAASLWGDVLALLASWGWAGVALGVRCTSLIEAKPQTQLFWQVLVSALVLSIWGGLSGEVIREWQPWHAYALLFQGVVVVAIGFLFWFWLLTIYPVSSVASFSFLSPVFGVWMGLWWLQEEITLTLWGALALVVAGLILMNWVRRSSV